MAINMRQKSWGQSFRDLLFPRLCFICGAKITDGFICPGCFKKIIFLPPPLCTMCSSPLRNGKMNICKNCLGKNFFYERLISITCYTEPLVSLLRLFKYKHYDFLKNFFCSIIINHLKKTGLDFAHYDLILSVPSHPLRIKERGYNQTELLGKLIAEYANLPFEKNILACKNYYESQTTLPNSQRLKNPKGCFSVSRSLPGKKIILIDDVVTTRATVSECSRVLKTTGAKNITVITLTKAG